LSKLGYEEDTPVEAKLKDSTGGEGCLWGEYSVIYCLKTIR